MIYDLRILILLLFRYFDFTTPLLYKGRAKVCRADKNVTKTDKPLAIEKKSPYLWS